MDSLNIIKINSTPKIKSFGFERGLQNATFEDFFSSDNNVILIEKNTSYKYQYKRSKSEIWNKKNWNGVDKNGVLEQGEKKLYFDLNLLF